MWVGWRLEGAGRLNHLGLRDSCEVRVRVKGTGWLKHRNCCNPASRDTTGEENTKCKVVSRGFKMRNT